MNPHVPTPKFSQYQQVTSLAASLPLPVSPPTPYYSEADPRPQMSPSVNISSIFPKG